jgi:hypothetical protein
MGPLFYNLEFAHVENCKTEGKLSVKFACCQSKKTSRHKCRYVTLYTLKS